MHIITKTFPAATELKFVVFVDNCVETFDAALEHADYAREREVFGAGFVPRLKVLEALAENRPDLEQLELLVTESRLRWSSTTLRIETPPAQRRELLHLFVRERYTIYR